MNKKIIARITFILAGTIFISGCAPMVSGVMNATIDENAISEKTAKYFGVTRENIAISSIEKGALATSYQAKYAGKIFNCLIYYGEVNCKQPGGQDARDGLGSVSGISRQAVPALNQISVVASDDSMTFAQAQARLNQLGYPVGVPDGVFGKKSVQQLKLFQQARGLSATGRLDVPTMAALR